MSPPSAEFSFDRRRWHHLLVFLNGILCVAGFLAGMVGGRDWLYSLRGAISLPAVFTPLFWLTGLRSIHLSYAISSAGILVRRSGLDLERIALNEIANVRPWPLAITLRSGRKVSFHLMRPEMQRALDALLEVIRDA